MRRVISPISLSQGSFISVMIWPTFKKKKMSSFLVLVACMDLMSSIFSVTHKLESTPRMKIAGCAVSIVLVHQQYAIRCFSHSTVLLNQWPSHWWAHQQLQFYSGLHLLTSAFCLDTRHRLPSSCSRWIWLFFSGEKPLLKVFFNSATFCLFCSAFRFCSPWCFVL